MRPFAKSSLTLLTLLPLRPLLPLLLIPALALTSARPSAQESAQPQRLLLWYSDNLSPVTGGDNLLTLHYAAGHLEDWLLPPSPWDESGFLGKTGAVGYRLARFLLIDFPLIDVLTDLPQHEVFGHGYRGREFGLADITYSFSPPPPYGKGGGLTNYFFPAGGISADQNLAIAMAGVEATAVMAGRLRSSWMLTGSMDYHGALLYTTAVGELQSYLGVTHEGDLNRDNPDLGNDMLSYIKSLNAKDGRTQVTNFRLHLASMKDQSAVGLLDPYLAFATWTMLKTYLWSGQSSFRFPAIPIGPVRYLPLAGYGLTPWGPEYLIENLAAAGNRVFTWRIRIGDDTFQKSWGSDLESVNLVSFAGYDFDLGLHLWKQPRLRLDPKDDDPTPSGYGGGASLDALSPALDLPIPLRLAAGGDYKTSGFVPGERMEGGIAWRIGLDIAL